MAAKDYVDSKSSKRRKGNSSRTKTVKNGSPINKAIIVVCLFVCLAAIVSVMKFLPLTKEKNLVTEKEPSPKKEQIINPKPKEKYQYRHLLEQNEVKVTTAEERKSNKQQNVSDIPNVIIDQNAKPIIKQKETRAQEAERANDILNGSLNTPKTETVHTIKIDSNSNSNRKDIITKSNVLVVDETKQNFSTQGNIYLQCGAFRNIEQASVLKSHIMSKDQSVNIIKATTSSGIWYRVVIGPFSTQSVAKDVLNKLKKSKTVDTCNVYN